jgi:hypothetical protein
VETSIARFQIALGEKKKSPGVRSHKSLICGEVLTSHSSINVPLRAHTGHELLEYHEYGEKPYKCKDHWKTFSYPQFFQSMRGLTRERDSLWQSL